MLTCIQACTVFAVLVKFQNVLSHSAVDVLRANGATERHQAQLIESEACGNTWSSHINRTLKDLPCFMGAVPFQQP